MIRKQTILHCDVVVVGAGASGIPAAVTLARFGKNVILLEEMPTIGGTMISGLGGLPICGLFKHNAKKPFELVNNGLAKELYEAILLEDPRAVECMGREHVLWCGVKQFDAICKNWIKKESRIQLITACSNVKIEEQNQRIVRIGFQDRNAHEFWIETKGVIDCSGNGVVVRNSSAQCIEPENPALAGIVFRVSDVIQNDLLPIKVPYILRKAVEKGLLPNYCRFTVYMPREQGFGFCKISIPTEIDMVQAKKVSDHIFEILHRMLPEFLTAKKIETSKRILQREGVRMKGQYLLTREDVSQGRRFKDSIAYGAWPMEFWNIEDGPSYSYVANGSTYDIPLRALKSNNIKNLWAAGRLISVDSAALASARVIGTCVATGEAAGRDAAKAVR